MILTVVTERASLQNRDGATVVVKNAKVSWVKIIKIFADGREREAN